MSGPIKPGVRIRDNDTRMFARVLQVISVIDGRANCYEVNSPQLRTKISIKRIHTDDKPRKSGFSLIKGPQP